MERLFQRKKLLDAGSKIKLNIKSVGEGYINAWIDLNADGDLMIQESR